MKFSKIEETISKMLSRFLKNFSMKMDVFSLKKLVDYMFVVVEKIVIKMKKLLPLYLTYYEDIVDEEISIANIHSDDEVLHMGCGPIPSTCILIAQKTGAATGIDKILRTVEEARSCIQVIKCGDKVQVKHANALGYPIENFDIVIVSQGIEPRDEILKYISQSMKADARVIFRTISSKEGDLTHHDLFLKSLFKIIKIVSHEQHGLLVSVMLLKK